MVFGLGCYCFEIKKIKEEMKEEGFYGGSLEYLEGEIEFVVVVDVGCRVWWYSLMVVVYVFVDSVCKDGIFEFVFVVVVMNCIENFEEVCWEKSLSWWEKVLNFEGIE